MGSDNAGMRLLAVYFWLSALGATACNHMQVLPEAKPQPAPSVQNLCQSLPYDCHQEGTMPCQSQADCACLGDFCAGVTDSIFSTATDLNNQSWRDRTASFPPRPIPPRLIVATDFA